jgi:uncharacterized protein YndB with AHSA1/START domain
MLKKIFIVLLVLVAVFVAVVAMQSPDFRITRSTTIAAPPSTVFAQVNDFHNWKAWSPWAKIDPAMKETYEGPPSGVGAIYSWQGNQEVGEGRMTILESRPNELVKIKLEFLKPFAATNTAEFTFKAAGDQTTVDWSMYGTKNFMMKAVHLFMSMEKMIGPDFEKGLAAMKATAEGTAK